ncbi:MAG: CpaF family protein [Syntrophomonadaceae bacterium]|nr:CpaF family protein [Syntrophomonadaceae bacterium]
MSLLKRLEAEKTNLVEITGKTVPENKAAYQHQELVHSLHREIIKELDTNHFRDMPAGREAGDNGLREEIQRLAQEQLEKESIVLSRMERESIISQVTDEILGYGPISPYLAQDDISEIMINGPHQVYVEKNGKLMLTPTRFRDDRHVLHVVDKIISPLGRRLDESMPMVDARLPDGSRVNAIIPPLALNGPVVTIRKFSSVPLTIEDLIRFGTLTPAMARLLEACVKGRLNIVVSGGTGAGKTSTLNVLSSFLPNHERIITIEDAAELKLNQEHVVSMETRPPNIEGKGEITIRDLVRNALRMRPDRIVVGEVRGGEALDMLQAMNTGHDGSLTTAHANSPRDMISRLETMVLMAGMDLPVRAIREQISSAIDLIVHQNRLRDGSRKITHITEVLGMEGDVVVLQDIFIYEQTGLDSRGKVTGRHRATGIRPRFLQRLTAEGIFIPADIFDPGM